MTLQKDWTGNSRSTHAVLGARNYAQNERENNDYYATEPKAAHLLMEVEQFSPMIWECACGEGHLAKEFEKAGYHVYATDLIDRGYGYQRDFLKCEAPPVAGFDIITNPPYSKAQEFVEHALDISSDGCKVAMFLKIQFLEGKARRDLFEKYPPKTVYVSSSRLRCAMNGDFEKYAKSTAVCYAWYVWVKGYTGDTVIKWIN
mgnify:FL=1|jgi:hypothetical protein|nr:MAG TPA: adenine-specific methyltransferase [Caudoviricetes sp.]